MHKCFWHVWRGSWMSMCAALWKEQDQTNCQTLCVNSRCLFFFLAVVAARQLEERFEEQREETLHRLTAFNTELMFLTTFVWPVTPNLWRHFISSISRQLRCTSSDIYIFVYHLWQIRTVTDSVGGQREDGDTSLVSVCGRKGIWGKQNIPPRLMMSLNIILMISWSR